MIDAMGTCSHEDSEPVLLTGTDDCVAQVCTNCLAQLPAAWGCDDCEWVEERALCQLTPLRRLARPCSIHREAP